jgi:hypothetical protein
MAREREETCTKNSPAPISRNIGAQNNEEKGEREREREREVTKEVYLRLREDGRQFAAVELQSHEPRPARRTERLDSLRCFLSPPHDSE